MISIVIVLSLIVVFTLEYHHPRTPEQKAIDRMARHDRRCQR